MVVISIVVASINDLCVTVCSTLMECVYIRLDASEYVQPLLSYNFLSTPIQRRSKWENEVVYTIYILMNWIHAQAQIQKHFKMGCV